MILPRTETSDKRSKEDPMLGPNHHAHQLANQMYSERLSHAARIQMVARDRRDPSEPVNHEGNRRLTVLRLAATAAGVALTFALAATAAGHAAVGGGGTTLIR
jgi:hypothetical protein